MPPEAAVVPTSALTVVAYDHTHTEIKLKLIDADNSVWVPRERGEGTKVKRTKYMVMGDDLTLGGGHTVQYTDIVT